MKREDYNVTITTASRELETREKMWLKSSPDAITIDACMADADSLLVEIDFYAVLAVHNEKANGDKDYNMLYIVDKSGMIYRSCSNSLITSLEDIAYMAADNGENISEYPVIITAKASKQYAGKNFYRAGIALTRKENGNND